MFEWYPLTAPAHLFDGPPADHRFALRARGAAAGVSLLVAALHEQPAAAARSPQRPAAAQLHALEPERDVPGLEPLAHRLLTQVLVGAAVPDDHRPCAVLALRDDPLEVAPRQGVVVDGHGEALVARVGRRSLRHRPGLERAVHLEAEVPVHAGGGVLLDHEARHQRRCSGSISSGPSCLASTWSVVWSMPNRSRSSSASLRRWTCVSQPAPTVTWADSEGIPDVTSQTWRS